MATYCKAYTGWGCPCQVKMEGGAVVEATDVFGKQLSLSDIKLYPKECKVTVSAPEQELQDARVA